MIKGSVLLKDITILNVYVLNNGSIKPVKQKQIKLHRERDEPIIIIGVVNTLISDIDPAGKKSVRTKLDSRMPSIS